MKKEKKSEEPKEPIRIITIEHPIYGRYSRKHPIKEGKYEIECDICKGTCIHIEWVEGVPFVNKIGRALNGWDKVELGEKDENS